MATPTDSTKPIRKSSTMLFNTLGLIGTVAMLSANPAAKTIGTILQDPAAQAQIVAIGGCLVNYVLRFKTSKKLKGL